MKVQVLHRAALVAAALGISLASPAPAHDWTFMRFPALHGSTVVFEAHGNLWQVSRWGGNANRLTADPGYDLMPRFSPDGSQIAFTGFYQGNQDVYVMPAGGGAAKRLTYHSDVVESAPTRWGPDNMVVTWTPELEEHRLSFAANGMEQLVRPLFFGAGAGRAGATAAARPRRVDDLRAGRPHHRL